MLPRRHGSERLRTPRELLHPTGSNNVRMKQQQREVAQHSIPCKHDANKMAPRATDRAVKRGIGLFCSTSDTATARGGRVTELRLAL